MIYTHQRLPNQQKSQKPKVYFMLRQNGRSPFEEYIDSIKEPRQTAAIQASIKKLVECGGYLPRPVAAHVFGKIWELRTRLGNRTFYFIHQENKIILLYGYTKKRDRIEARVLSKIQSIYEEYLQNGLEKFYI